MSELSVPVTQILKVEKHPNADRLDIVTIFGWPVVVSKDSFKVGDIVIFIPPDSVLPNHVESYLFPPDSKVKLSKSRIKTIKLRGAISQGLIIDLSDYLKITNDVGPLKVGDDVAEKLGITKYEPPVSSQPTCTKGNIVSKKCGNPNFVQYTDIQNFKHYNQLFEEGELVYVTEKLHGTSARYGYLPTKVDTFWKKIKKFMGMLPEYEFCYGSRRVQLQDKKYNGYYPTDVYSKIARQLSLKERLAFEVSGYHNIVVYGEIVGGGIQKNYTYGLGQNEHEFYAYDIQVDGKYLDPEEFLAICWYCGIPIVPQLFSGRYSQEKMAELATGDSTIRDQKIREGIVIKPIEETTCYIGRKILKYLNDEYLLKDQDDFH